MDESLHDFSATYPLESVIRRGARDGRGWYWDWSPPFYHSPGPTPRHTSIDDAGKVSPPAFLSQMASAASTEIKQLMKQWSDVKGELTQQGAALAASIPATTTGSTPAQERTIGAAHIELARLCEAYESGFEKRSREARVVQDEYLERCAAYRAANETSRVGARRREDRTLPPWDDPKVDLPKEFIAKEPAETWLVAIHPHENHA